ncbi:MAG: alkaline phosphatase family protein [Bacteroidia bacterium]|nr:alkaline phosphatase family protein [Bacteroidia bacterium]
MATITMMMTKTIINIEQQLLMVKNSIYYFVLYLAISNFGFTVCAQQAISKIAFGSCANQSARLPIFNVVVEHKPDLFVFLGDNVYGDTHNMDTLAAIYGRMAAKPTFKNLKQNVPLIATWDDHDYGQNDAGRHFPEKEKSKQVFLDFFDEPKESERRTRPGVYQSYYYQNNGKTTQVILLDCRTFRDDLIRFDKRKHKCLKNGRHRHAFAPYTVADSTMLGEEQWKWLEEELKKPADLRIIGSGSQFGIEYNGYESWANFPHEQKRMFNLIKSTQANGVLFISGDVHYAEISKINEPGLYPIYDITASGLSSTWEFATPNKNRIEGPVMQNHFGLITVNWQLPDPEIALEIWDVDNKKAISYLVKLSTLKFSN